jgi:hypothetical protein
MNSAIGARVESVARATRRTWLVIGDEVSVVSEGDYSQSVLLAKLGPLALLVGALPATRASQRRS